MSIVINKQNEHPCPGCRCPIQGFTLFPLNFGELVQGRASQNHEHSKRKRDEDNDVLNGNPSSISPFLHWHGSSVIGSSESRHFRVGRWTPGETFFADELIRQFYNSSLPLPKGIKLNEFLRDILMCKNSRLTKKMKSAKLSTRSYDHSNLSTPECFTSLSAAQDSYLASITSDSTRSILHFNLQWVWRLNFSNLCLQVGYESLDSKEWLLSLEEMEKKVSCASETFRQVRRRKMEVALRQDFLQDTLDGVYLVNKSGSASAFTTHGCTKPNIPSKVSFCSSSIASDDTPSTIAIPQSQFLSEISPLHHESLNDDMSISFMSIFDDDELHSPAKSLNEYTNAEKSPFISRIVHFIEEKNFPFHYVDIWVPCCSPGEEEFPGNPRSLKSMRLVHGGDGIMHQLVNDDTVTQLLEFGVYSRKFSFGYGAGMPGRVYASEKTVWEEIKGSTEQQFQRITGAQVFGVQTVVGIAIPSTTSHQVVVGLYSLNKISHDTSLIDECKEAFQYFDPKPKWSLMIDCLSTSGTGGHIPDHESSHAMHSKQDSTILKIDQKQIEQMTLLLAEHMPVHSNSDDSRRRKEQDAFISLRLLLLRSPSGCSNEELEALKLLIKSYEGYCKVKRNSCHIAWLLIKDWDILLPSSKMTHVNYDANTSKTLPFQGMTSFTQDVVTSFKDNEGFSLAK